MTRWIVPAVALAGVAAGAGAMWAAGGSPDKARVERIVHEYVLSHPEIIPAAMERLQRREQGRAVKAAGDAVTTPYGGAFVGNPRGDVVLVQYYDYNCGYCRASEAVIARLVAEDPGLKVVFRELPLLAPSSRDGARASLAAAKANRFKPFHDALFAGGRVTPETIALAARRAGVTVPRDVSEADAEIGRNFAQAGELGINGVPSWVVGDQVFVGAQSAERLKAAIEAARRG